MAVAVSAVYATDMPDFWQHLQELEFSQFWKELGQTLKDKEAMPLDLAGFDSSSNMQVADLRRRVKKLDFTGRLNTLNMTDCTDHDAAPVRKIHHVQRADRRSVRQHG